MIGSASSPQTINDEEELERIAGLQLRESIVRSMGVSEHLRTMLESHSYESQTPRPQQESHAHHIGHSLSAGAGGVGLVSSTRDCTRRVLSFHILSLSFTFHTFVSLTVSPLTRHPITGRRRCRWACLRHMYQEV